jgi:hypothetical protein
MNGITKKSKVKVTATDLELRDDAIERSSTRENEQWITAHYHTRINLAIPARVAETLN